MKSNKKIINWKKAAALGVAAVMTFSMAGCGDKAADPSAATSQAETGVNGYVYVPDFMELGSSTDDENMSGVEIYGKYMYYSIYRWNKETMESSQDLYRKELGSEGEAETLAIPSGDNRNVMKFLPAQDGGMYFFVEEYQVVEEGAAMTGQAPESSYFLSKYDADGNQVFEQDITEVIRSGDEFNRYIQHAAIDGEGRIYAGTSELMWLFDPQGAYQGTVQIQDWINSMGTGKDGKVYVTQHGTEGMELKEVDFVAKALGKSYKNFPGGGSNAGLVPGIEKDFLVSDNNGLYEYDMNAQSSEKLLDWLDSDINGSYVESLAVLEDGRVAVILRDWGGESSTTELAMLTKTEASKVTQKEIITVGTLYMDQMLQAAAVKFNKTNDKYRVNVKTYVDQSGNMVMTENSYKDAITAMNTDITSGNGPDLLNLTSEVNLKSYVEKGLLEDLGTYLDSSAVIKKEDFLEPVLNAYTIDGKLISIPTSFTLQTVVGRTELVGDKMGWTLDEMMAFADKYPDKEIFSDVTKNYILSYCFSYNQEEFIDYETGECRFDSEGFRKVLEFANRFPKDFHYDENAKSSYAKLMDGDALLMDLYISGIDDYAMNMEIFGGDPVTAIGYPTLDGSVGCLLNAANGSYGMSSKSSHKDGAWAFLESLLSDSSANQMFSYGLPTRREKLDATIEEAMDVTYVLDENGEKVLDENGNPMRESRGGWSSDDFSVEYYGATQEQVDAIMALIDVAKPAVSNDMQIMNIVTEEAAPYFEGQKSLDEVVGIIQNRVQIYVSENS